MRQRKTPYILVSLAFKGVLQAVISGLLPTVSCEVSLPRPVSPFVEEPDLRSLLCLRRGMFSLGMTDFFLLPCRAMASWLRTKLYAGSSLFLRSLSR